MALFDFIPVILFGISGRLLMRGLYNKMSKGCFACLDLGVCVSFLAGFLKALYKLLIATGVGNYPLLTRLFLPLRLCFLPRQLSAPVRLFYCRLYCCSLSEAVRTGRPLPLSYILVFLFFSS